MYSLKRAMNLRLPLILGVATLSGTLAAAPVVTLQPARTPPAIDGQIDDEAWRGAAYIDAFTQVLPRPGAAASERTEVWITYDPDHLFIAVRCHDREPERIHAAQLQRDADLKSDDLVRFVLDTFNRRQDGYYFEVNPAGARIDGLIEHNNEPELEWDTIWQARARIDGAGWSAEIAIPTTSLAFDPSGSTWGFNIDRMIRRREELVRWSGHAAARDVSYLPDGGALHGLTGLRHGRGIEFRPFATLRHTALASRPEDERTEFNPGFDLLWHVTPSLAATLTVNTDFAETEVDDREVNLGRFPLFFPEKRAFFQQDAPLFAFGNITYNPRPFFSRRIGLTPEGRPVDILAGFKLTGRHGPVTLGVLDAQVDSFDGVDSKNLFAGRVAVQLSEKISAGLLATHGEPRANGDNAALGFDFNYLLNQPARDRSLEMHLWAVGTDSDLAGGRDTAAAFQLLYPNEPFEFQFFAGRYGSRYDPGLGFAPRTGIHEFKSSGTWLWRNVGPFIRKLEAGASLEFITDLQGRIESEGHEMSFGWENPSNDEFDADIGFERERLTVPFEIRPGNVIPAGDYRFTRFGAELDSNSARPVSVHASVSTGGFYNGRRDDYEVEINWNASKHLHIGAAHEWRNVRLPGGEFQVRLAELRLALLFSPDLSISTLAQYDNDSRDLGVNLRFRWTVTPGNDLFLVLNQGYDVDTNHIVPRRSDLAAKAAWTLRF